MNHDPEHLIDQYLDGTLSPEEGAALNAWVKQDPANARRFARAAWMHRQVYDQLHVRDLQQLSDDAAAHGKDDSGVLLAHLEALERGSGDSGIVDLTDELKRRHRERRRNQVAARAARQLTGRHAAPEQARVLIIPKLLVYGIAALVAVSVLAAVYGGWMTGRRGATPSGPVVQDPAGEAQALPPVVAELVNSEGLVWGDRSLSTRPGTALRRGSLVLDRGIAEVRFQSGAVATFRAPAVIELRGDNRMVLTEGAMVAEVPEQAYGFTVDTPTMRVVDLGTEFGVTADPAGDSAVQVFVGEVTASVKDFQGRVGDAQLFHAWQGVSVRAEDRAARRIEVDGRAFEDLAPHVALLRRNLVVNGDFEQGEPAAVTGAEFHHVQNLRVPGWEDFGPGTVIAYDAASAYDYPNPALHPMPDDRGQSFYVGMAEGEIRQRIGVADLAGLLDSEQVVFDLSGWMGGFAQQDEYLLLTAYFLDARGRPVGDPVALKPVHVYDRGGESGFVLRREQGAVPAGTRTIELVIEHIGDHAPPNVRDGYADNIELLLSAR